MGLTNNLKQQVDLPVWEYCRFAPTNTTAVSSLTTGNNLGNRYLYYQVSAALYRYDTITDSWHQLSSPSTASTFYTPTIMNNNVLSNYMGHYGQAITGSTNTIQLAGLNGHSLIGYKIRIISGTGAGQERTITDVSAPTIHDRGEITTASYGAVIDANTGAGLKQWKTNQWRNYQIRFDFGTAKGQMRPILYNNLNSAYFLDTNYLTINPWAQNGLPTATAVGTLYLIESHQVTVDTNWSIIPDSTSNFVILSGGIWNISQGVTSAPFFTFMYYDILSDVWYQKSTQTGLKTAVFLAASDLSMERMTEAGGVISTGTTASGGSRYLVANETFTPMQYANYEIRIVSGTTSGNTRTILSNTNHTFNVTRDWPTAPDTSSKFEIWRDNDKIWLIGGGDSGMLQYSRDTDQWTTGKQLDFGQCNQLAATLSGQQPFALTSITRTATSMVLTGSVSTQGTGYNVDDILTVDAKGGTLRVLTINPVNGAVLTVSLETCGTGYSTGAKSTTVTPAGGTGCQITLAAGDIDFTELAVTPIAHNFKIGESVTITGASGTGASKFNGAYTIVGNSTNNLSFNYCSVGDPGASTATIANSPSSTQLVDCTKNWVPGEHIGKLVQLSSNVILSVGQVRRIIGNTATTLTWTLSATAPVNGTSRYVIEDIKPFGTERSYGGITGNGTEGFATSGSVTTLVDTTKNWPVNFWSKTTQRKFRIVEGTGVGNEIAITSNTNNTLTFATQAFSPDTTTRYIIMDTFGSATAGTTTSLTDSTKNWEVNAYANKRVRFLSGTGQGNEYTITSNTATVLNFATGTAPDVSTAYAILEAPQKTYGIHLDCVFGSTDLTLNNKYLYSFTGTISSEVSRYDITTEHWEIMTTLPQGETLTTGSMYCYDGKDRIYFWSGTALRLMYYDLTKNIVVPSSTPPYNMSTAIISNRMEIIQTVDGLKYLYLMRHSATEMWRLLIYW